MNAPFCQKVIKFVVIYCEYIMLTIKLWEENRWERPLCFSTALKQKYFSLCNMFRLLFTRYHPEKPTVGIGLTVLQATHNQKKIYTSSSWMCLARNMRQKYTYHIFYGFCGLWHSLLMYQRLHGLPCMLQH